MFKVILQLTKHVYLHGLSGLLIATLRGMLSLFQLGRVGPQHRPSVGQEPLFEPRLSHFQFHVLYGSVFLLDILR